MQSVANPPVMDEARLQLQALLDSAKDACILADASAAIVRWNSAAEKLYGHSPDEVHGRELALLVPAEERPALTALLDRAKAGERVEDQSMHHLRRGGMAFPVA